MKSKVLNPRKLVPISLPRMRQLFKEIKGTKALFAVVIAGLVLTSAAVEASFKGALKQGVEFAVQVDNTGSLPGEKVGITILMISRRDKISSADHSTIDGGQGGQLKGTAGAGIERVIIFVNPTFERSRHHGHAGVYRFSEPRMATRNWC